MPGLNELLSKGTKDAAIILEDQGEPKYSIRRDLRTKNPVRQGRGKQAGEGGRTLDIHVGNVTLYH
jgi:hypothetical protein